MKKIVSSLVVMGVLFSGCGSSDSESPTDTEVIAETPTVTEPIVDETPTAETPIEIITINDFEEKYSLYKSTSEKSDYETSDEYVQRINSFIDTEKVYFYNEISDSYDIESKIITVYNDNLDPFIASWKTYNTTNFGRYAYSNINEISFEYDGDKITYFVGDMDASEAESLNGSFYSLVENKLDSTIGFTELKSTVASDFKYAYIKGNAVSIKIYNTQTGDKVYAEWIKE